MPANDETVDLFALFGGSAQAVASPSFRGGRAMALFGGVELDLRQARPQPEGADLRAVAFAGGVVVVVPPDWDVRIEGTPVLGGIADSRRKPKEGGTASPTPPGAQRPVLRVKAVAMMGGVNIKSDPEDD